MRNTISIILWLYIKALRGVFFALRRMGFKAEVLRGMLNRAYRKLFRMNHYIVCERRVFFE